MAKGGQKDFNGIGNTKGPAFEDSAVNDVTGLAKRIRPSDIDMCKRIADGNDHK